MEILIEGALDYCEVKEWKKRYFVMKYEISSALRYIEIYKDKNWRKQLPRHVVNLHPGYEVKRVKNDPKKKYSFLVKTTDHCLMLSADDENVMNQWLATFEEYNLVKSFCVQPQDTPTMIRIAAILPCHLQMVHSEVRLVSAMDGKLLGLWPFKCIRRYKFTGNVFSIEAGRKAPTGEGIYEFISNECSEVYRVMDTIIRTKAGDSTIRRLASHKQPPRTDQHHKIRKTVSQPHSIPNEDVHYDYATPSDKITRSPPPAPHANYPSPPTHPPLPSSLEEGHYDSLSPSEASPNNFNFESKFNETIKQEPSSYDSLQFKETKPEDTSEDTSEDKVIRSSSAGSYDTLVFNNKQSVQGSDYNKLQFSKPTRQPRRNNSGSSIDDDNVPCSGKFEKAEGTLRSSDVYNTLSRLDITAEPPPANSNNTYDSLNSGQVTGSKTYDSFGEKPSLEKQGLALDDTYNRMSNVPTLQTPDDMYNHMSNVPKPQTPEDTYNRMSNVPTPQTPEDTYNCMSNIPKPQTPDDTYNHTMSNTGKLQTQEDTYNRISNTPSPITSSNISEPVVPVRPPPRHSKPGKPSEMSPPRRPAPERPSRPPRQTSVDNVDGNTVANPVRESLKDVIQRRSANIADDDGCYATVDHDYASIDYSKVSRSETTLISAVYSEPVDVQNGKTSDVYSEPSEAIQTAPINFPKPVKPKRNPPPRTLKNLFKKGPISTPPMKPKPLNEEGDFANELKKKLEVKLKKAELGTKDGGRPKNTVYKQENSHDNDDSIYAEVDDSELNV